MKEQRADTPDSICAALNACTQAVAPLTGAARLRVLAGLRAFIQDEGPFTEELRDSPGAHTDHGRTTAPRPSRSSRG